MKTYKVTVDEYGTIRCYNEDGQLHREDGPAVEWANGDKSWYLNGQRHREDGPSTIWLCHVTEFVFGRYPDRIYYL